MLSDADLSLLRRLATGDTLHGDDPFMATLLALEERGLGRARYHFGWYFDITDPALRLAVEGDGPLRGHCGQFGRGCGVLQEGGTCLCSCENCQPTAAAKCGDCNGHGDYRTSPDGAPGAPCETCDGHGFFMVSAHGPQEVKCDTCSGTGNKSGTRTPR